jgi:hypothetical protein
MKFILLTIIIIHGLIHILGFVKAFNIAPVNQLTRNIPKPAGLFWLFTAILFILVACFYFFGKDWCWIICFAAVIISQVLIIRSWNDAKYGTIVNLILLFLLISTYSK